MSVRVRLVERKCDSEGGAGLVEVRDLDSAVVSVDDAPHDRQAKARPRALVFESARLNAAGEPLEDSLAERGAAAAWSRRTSGDS